MRRSWFHWIYDESLDTYFEVVCYFIDVKFLSVIIIRFASSFSFIFNDIGYFGCCTVIYDDNYVSLGVVEGVIILKRYHWWWNVGIVRF